MDPSRRLRAGDTDRDAILQVLQQAHAEGRLTVEELGERQDTALRATYTDQFGELVEDLPGGRELATGVASGVVPRPAVHLPVSGVPERTTWSVMSGRSVDIEPGTRHYRNFAWWGGDDIDLTRAMGPGAVVTLELPAVMAGHNIYVPEGVRVVDDSMAIMAGHDVRLGSSHRR